MGRSWIMGMNEKKGVRKEAQREDLGKEETKKLMTRDEERKAKKREMDKQERKRDLAYSRKIGGQAISMKKKMRKELREKHKTKTGGQVADDQQQQKEVVDIIKNPWKHNKNIKKNIQL